MFFLRFLPNYNDTTYTDYQGWCQLRLHTGKHHRQGDRSITAKASVNISRFLITAVAV